jgi:hypothetical protein
MKSVFIIRSLNLESKRTTTHGYAESQSIAWEWQAELEKIPNTVAWVEMIPELDQTPKNVV